MEKHNASACAPADEDRGQKCRQFKGIRMRKWGKWVSEIRMPKSQEKIWLGSYNTAEQAARAYDAAVYCLRGPAGKLNFPGSVPNIPSASSLSRQQIQLAATKYALGEISSTSIPLHNNSEAREKRASPSGSSWISETDFSGNNQHISKELVDWDLWESLFDGGNESLNLEKLPSNGESSASEFVPSGEQKSEVWKFRDI